MADPEPFDDDLVIPYPWTASLLVDEMEDHGQLVVRGPEAAQLSALAALQAGSATVRLERDLCIGALGWN